MERCPRCGSNNVNETDVEGDGNMDWHDWKCYQCKFTWTEYWERTGWSYGRSDKTYPIDHIPDDFQHRRRIVGLNRYD